MTTPPDELTAETAPAAKLRPSLSDDCGPVSHEEASKIAQRFIDAAFNNHGRERPHFEIPANPKRDDDLRLSAYIEQQEETARLAAERGERIAGLEAALAETAESTLLATIAERDRLRAFFAEHGEHLLAAAEFTSSGIETEMPGHPAARADPPAHSRIPGMAAEGSGFRGIVAKELLQEAREKAGARPPAVPRGSDGLLPAINHDGRPWWPWMLVLGSTGKLDKILANKAMNEADLSRLLAALPEDRLLRVLDGCGFSIKALVERAEKRARAEGYERGKAESVEEQAEALYQLHRREFVEHAEARLKAALAAEQERCLRYQQERDHYREQALATDEELLDAVTSQPGAVEETALELSDFGVRCRRALYNLGVEHGKRAGGETKGIA